MELKSIGHGGLIEEQSKDVERIQKRVIKIIFRGKDLRTGID